LFINIKSNRHTFVISPASKWLNFVVSKSSIVLWNTQNLLLMKNYLPLFSLILLLASACIGDDIIMDRIPERLNISNGVDSVQVNTTYQFEADFFNNIGQQESRSINWISTDDAVISIDTQGLATANSLGGATIIASTTLEDNTSIEDEMELWVSEGPTVVMETSTERTGTIRTTSSYNMGGDFTLSTQGDDLVLDFASNYNASSGLPGLYIYLTNNPNTTSGALEIGKVDVFNGAHSYTISGVDIDEYNYILYFCKPFSVKVGDGEIEN